ncbi:acetate--CoA ligase family protein [Gemmatimonadota bacterium]
MTGSRTERVHPLDALFFPRSVAVIGASTKELSIGNRIIKNLQDFGYTGQVFAINPKGEEVRGLRPYTSILDVPDEVELAHIVIPAGHVSAAMEECARKGVRVVIVNSAGFREVGSEGDELERQVVTFAREHGIRVFGPNCQGIINTDPGVRAYCNFTFTRPVEGSISIVAQSGGVAEMINQRFAEMGTGVRMYASNGNAADISIPEVIRYWGADDLTKVIVVYVESLSDPAAFLEAAREVAAEKPVLGMKAGRTVEGARAVSSHTGGLARQEIVTELLFENAGMVTFRDVEEMCQAAVAFSSQPVPKGNRVGLITNTGGPAIIATDELVEAGLLIPPLSETARIGLKEQLHAAASISNPIDVLATAGADHFRAAIDALMDEDDIDSVYINFVTPFFVDNESIARELVEVNAQGRKPIVCNLMTDRKEWADTVSILRDGGIPTYTFPEMAARSLAAMTRLHQIRSRESGDPVWFEDVDREGARAILDAAWEGEEAWLSADRVYGVLEAYGIPVAPWRTACGAADAAIAAGEIGFPVVVKADSPKIVHKSDTGGVVMDLRDAGAVRETVERMDDLFETEDLDFLVQSYLPGGLELIAGAKAESGVGHLLMFGMGGVHVEVLKDVSFALAPVTPPGAERMLDSLRSRPILDGVRGKKGVDREAILELLQRLSQLVTEQPYIKEIDLNPIIAFDDRIVVVDARIGL